MQQDATDWNQLVIDRAAVPSPVDEGRYRQWLGTQRVFVSSVMDDELSPYREAVQKYFKEHGGAGRDVGDGHTDSTSAYIGA